MTSITMHFDTNIPCVVLLILMVVVGAVVSNLLTNKRRKDLAAWAARRGFSFSPERACGMDARYAGIQQLCRGENRFAYNIASGTLGALRVTAFDYHYETHSSNKGHRRTQHHRFSAVIVEPGMFLKPLLIRPEGLFDKLAKFVGVEDIDFESAEFSRKFFVKAQDRKWAYDIIQQATMELLLESPRHTIEMAGQAMAAYNDSVFSIAKFDAAIALLHGVCNRIPPSVIQEYKGRLM